MEQSMSEMKQKDKQAGCREILLMIKLSLRVCSVSCRKAHCRSCWQAELQAELHQQVLMLPVFLQNYTGSFWIFTEFNRFDCWKQ